MSSPSTIIENVPRETSAAATVAQALSVGYVETFDGYVASERFVTDVPIAFARKFGVLGVESPGANGDGRRHLAVALSDPSSLEQVDVVGRFLVCAVTPLFAPAEVVALAIDNAYQARSGQAQAHIDALHVGDADMGRTLDEVRELAGRPGRDDLLDNASRAPVIRLVNLLLFEAVKAGASDVHVQPYEDRLVVRTRIDGVLYDVFTLPKPIQEEVISRLKVMGRMNIAEKRLPQDGRATVQVGRRVVDLRVASLPTSYGERVVVRLLDKSARLYDLTEIGMDGRTLELFTRLIAVEHGLILVTGPTGSGKTTTLYSALKRINSAERNILTLEDPIEYQLEGISQSQVSEKKGMTFASGLRSVLRQDPDVIMVGEIRDLETATMAIQSSLTGHLVFSTLHTNDAATAVTRLLDLGIEPYLVASSVIGVLAQRLVRRVCEACAQSHRPTPSELAWLGVLAEGAARMRVGAGCAECRRTGYRGRVGAFELLVLDEPVRRLVQSRATASEIKEAARRTGSKSLREDGIAKVLAGLTTIAEVERVTLNPQINEDASVGRSDVAPTGQISDFGFQISE